MKRRDFTHCSAARRPRGRYRRQQARDDFRFPLNPLRCLVELRQHDHRIVPRDIVGLIVR
jgi:hypothetical protein